MDLTIHPKVSLSAREIDTNRQKRVGRNEERGEPWDSNSVSGLEVERMWQSADANKGKMSGVCVCVCFSSSYHNSNISSTHIHTPETLTEKRP